VTTSASAAEVLAEGVVALLASHSSGPGQVRDASALLKEAARAGWLDAVHLGLSGADGLALESAFVVCEAFGRYVTPFSLLVAAGFVKPLLAELGSGQLAGQVESWLDDGAVVAIPAPRLIADPACSQQARFHLGDGLRAEEGQGGVRLFGSVDRVTDTNATGVIVTCGAWLAAVPLDSPGVTVRPVPAVVAGQEVGRVEFDGVLVGGELIHRDGVAHAVDRAATVWSLALDGLAVGICRELVSRTVQFALDRRQFGQPVGAFQAVQHLCGSMQIAAETSFSTLLAAAASWTATPEDSLEQVVASRLHAAASAVAASETAIQVHGGIGMTWEMGIHVWYRAAQFARRYLTEEAELRAFLARRLVGAASAGERGTA
jgi:alkylation response protein AidB-like acyl-CoA dehydrogenase